jgi:hypothetical protein
MSEQKDPNASNQIDAASASTALALAVMTAEKSSRKRPKLSLEKASALLRKAGDLARAVPKRHAAQAAAVAVAIGVGWAGGSQALSGGRQALQALPGWAEAASSSIRQNHEDIVRLSGDMRALRDTLVTFQESFQVAKTEAAGQSRALMERLEDIERGNQDATAKIVRVAEASERAAADARIAQVAGRLDAVERQVAASKPGQAAAADPAQTGSVPDLKTAAKPGPLEGWVLREVYDGAALVESRNGRLHEVVPGRNLPGVGRVEAIEQRGKIWVVVTSKGVIGPPARWR